MEEVFALLLLALRPASSFNFCHPGVHAAAGNHRPAATRVTPEMLMRLPPLQRRTCIALSTWLLSGMVPGAPARADSPFGFLDPAGPSGGAGVKKEMPGFDGKILKQNFGFESCLPRLEAVRDQILRGLRLSVERGNYTMAKFYLDTKYTTYALSALGDTASILGRDSYDAEEVKKLYAGEIKRLNANLALDMPNQKQALVNILGLEKCVEAMIDYIPASVVEQVRARLKLEAQLRAGENPFLEMAAAEAQ